METDPIFAFVFDVKCKCCSQAEPKDVPDNTVDQMDNGEGRGVAQPTFPAAYTSCKKKKNVSWTYSEH